MSRAVACQARGASAAFDRMAYSYDSTFTKSVIGRAQRRVVWDALKKAFHSGDRVLELNCGTGEDALFLASRGVSVTAYDASPRMIEVAETRKSTRASNAQVQFGVLRNENLAYLAPLARFDGAFSNFSGLNCMENVRDVAMNLARLIRPEGRVLVCVSTRSCLWEIVWYAAQGNFGKAFRRVRGSAIAQLDEIAVPVWYPTIQQMRRMFSIWFRLQSIRAVGLFVPPSYVEQYARGHRKLLAVTEKMDRIFAAWPLLRAVGDHVLLEFERTTS
jgi:ubiquinone/menaquinone biosynthesis C-methylase UbiE